MTPDQKFKKRYFLGLAVFIVLSLIGMLGVYLVRTNEAVGWRYENLVARIKYAIFPPEKQVFVPQDQLSVIVSATFQAMTPSSTPTATITPPITSTPAPTSTATVQPTAIPTRKLLKGIKHEFQQWNNCGPANLAMILSFWGWAGDQRDTAAFLKPNPRDKNVMPYEMKAYVEANTGLSVLIRTGGTIEMLNALNAAGFPVLIERGFEGSSFDGWMGHYEVISGYDLEQNKVYAQDSYIGPDFPIADAQLLAAWRAFNYIYLVIYPPERENEVMSVLGPQADESYNLSFTADKASVETVQLSGQDLFFAWYNRGTSLVNLGDYTGAALAYDEAYQIYPTLEEKERPWRMIWYQTGPYYAYFYTARYYDVINLATSTLSAMSEPVLEESYVWRARARIALGDIDGAIEDLNTALEVHPGFQAAQDELNNLTAQ